MAEKSISIAVAGSSLAVAEDLLAISKGIVHEEINWLKAVGAAFDYAKVDLVICGPLRVDTIAKQFDREKIIVLDTTPSTTFFIQLAQLPDKSIVHIFNNTRVWCELTAKQCLQAGIHHLEFVFVPYEEVMQTESIALLQEARVVVGKSNMIESGGALDTYRQYLRPDIRLMPMERMGTVETIKECIKKITIARYLKICHEVVAIIDTLKSKSLAVKTAADEITHSVEQNMSGIRELSDTSIEETQRVNNVSRVSTQLEATVKNIGSISETIKKISGQTKLLALNASIEAARVGSAGRGFAVVAQEVGVLAAETDNSTKHIRQNVGDVQEAVRELVNELTVFKQTVERNSQHTAKLTNQLEEESTKLQEIFANLDEINAVGIHLATVADKLLIRY